MYLRELANHLFDWCGKDTLRNKWAGKVETLIETAKDDCSPTKEPVKMIVEEEEEETTTIATTTTTTMLPGWTMFGEWTDISSTTTTTTTEATTTPTTTTKLITTTMMTTTFPQLELENYLCKNMTRIYNVKFTIVM